MNFASRVRAGSAGRADAPAIIAQEGQLTHRELWALADGFARSLEPGSKVAILSETSPRSVAAYFGALEAGCTAIPLGTSLPPAHLEEILRTTGVRLAYAPAKVAAECATALAGIEVVSDWAPSETPVLHEVDPRALGCLLFTSGSTSRPRGVMLSHDNLLANAESIIEVLGLRSDDRAMLVLPAYYAFGASVLHTLLAVGGSVVIDRRFMFPNKVLDRMAETKCTGFAGVPSHFQILLRKSKLKTMALPDLRWLQQAGGKLPRLFIDELRASLPKVTLFVMYGATEATARLSVLPPEKLEAKRGSIGRGLPGVTLRILREDGSAAAVGEVGEIVAEGRNIALGYFNAPEETAATFRNGRLHTGDLAMADQDGDITIVDRAKDFLKCGGNRTSSKLVEEQLLAFEEIVECAVIGVHDDLLGEAVAAFVVPRDPKADVEAPLRAFAAKHLPPHLQPKVVKVMAGLPKNTAGKVMKPALREAL